MTPLTLQPVSPGERVDLLDVLRGFALFGVLVSNAVQVATDRLVVSPEALGQLSTSGIDAGTHAVFAALIYGKFLILFGLLFGLGFAIQERRAESRGTSVVPVYLRRMGWLFVIGMTHLALWWGDILHNYALAGCLLLGLRRWSDRTLLTLGLALAVLPTVIVRVVSRHLRSAGPSAPTETPDLLTPLLSNDLFDVLSANASLFIGHITPAIGLIMVLHPLGYFLLGYVLGRRQMLHRVNAHRATFRKALIWGLAFGLPANVLFASHRHWWSMPEGSLLRPLGYLVFNFGYVSLSVAYLAAIALLFESPGGRRALQRLAPVGRMALTNYLTQSLVYLLVFTGIGFGLFGQIGTSIAVGISLGVFALQIVFSHGWLRRFRFGPAEWLWRSLTYRSWQPMTAAQAKPPATSVS